MWSIVGVGVIELIQQWQLITVVSLFLNAFISPQEETNENSLFLMFFLDRESQYDDLKQVLQKKSSPSGKSSQVERMMKSYYLGQGEYTDDKEQGQDFILILTVSFNICLISSNPSHSVQSQV